MSDETEALIVYMRMSGVPHRVTSTTGGDHTANSRHYVGLAVDFAGPTPGRNTPELRAIFDALLHVEKQLYELFYTPARFSIRSGKRTGTVWKHWDHVHVSVNRGVLVKWPFQPAPPPTGRVEPMFNPPLQIVAWLDAPGGGCWLLGSDGGVFAVGGAIYYGGVNAGPLAEHFVGRTPAQLELGNGNPYQYVVVATSGERYGLPV